MVLITGSSIPISIEIIAYVYLAIGFVSALYIVYDICIRRHYQMMSIMNVVWPITAWYLGPLALWSYWHIGHLNTKIQREKETQGMDHLSSLMYIYINNIAGFLRFMRSVQDAGPMIAGRYLYEVVVKP